MFSIVIRTGLNAIFRIEGEGDAWRTNDFIQYLGDDMPDEEDIIDVPEFVGMRRHDLSVIFRVPEEFFAILLLAGVELKCYKSYLGSSVYAHLNAPPDDKIYELCSDVFDNRKVEKVEQIIELYRMYNKRTKTETVII